jgi:coiled-coil and C2 domain-containing protein 2A
MKIEKTRFLLHDPYYWKAIFQSKPSLLPPIQVLLINKPIRLEYINTSSKFTHALEQMLERAIVSKFEEWRKGNVTRWNRLCSRSLKTLLSRFEQDIIAGISIGTSIQESAEISSIARVYKMTGHPINIPYTDVGALLSVIFNSDVHSNISTGVEFALAIHCEGYPGKFVSVWIFLASLVRA